MAKPIMGRIVRIIDPTTLIINRGTNHGVKNGMTFIIFEEGEEVIDPDTGESLGKYELVKGIVEVTNVQENMSQVRPPFENTSHSPTTLSTLMSEESKRSSTRERTELLVKSQDISGIVQVSSIVVGDCVRSFE